MNCKATVSHSDAIRRALSNRSVMRRDELFLALPLDLDELETTLNEMIGRGEVETLRAYCPNDWTPNFYRLVLDSEYPHEKYPKRCTKLRCKLVGISEIEYA